MAKFYTATGDDGFTGLLGEGRVPKSDPRIEAVGTLDEATAALGLARAGCQTSQIGLLLLAIQRDLYHLMAEVSATPENAARFRKIDAQRIMWLELQIDSIAGTLDIPKEFIIPGDSPSGAALAVARTIVRRAERRVALLYHQGDLENVELLRYLNRLSSLCFLLEILENKNRGINKPTLANQPT